MEPITYHNYVELRKDDKHIPIKGQHLKNECLIIQMLCLTQKLTYRYHCLAASLFQVSVQIGFPITVGPPSQSNSLPGLCPFIQHVPLVLFGGKVTPHGGPKKGTVTCSLIS